MDDRSKIEAAAEAMWQEESRRCLGRARLIAWDEEGDDIRQKWIGLARVAASALTTPEPKAGTGDGWEARALAAEAALERLRAALDRLVYAAQGGNAEIGNVEAFRWLADRLVNVYGESPNVDFVRALRTRAAMLEVPLDEARSALNQEASRGKS